MRLLDRLRGRLSYATAVSLLSLFLLVAGGAAYASGQLGKNSVGAQQLRKNAVTASKIKANAVTAAKIKKSAITDGKFTKGSLSAQSIDLGSTSYSRTVAVLKSAGPVPIGEKMTSIPLASATYVQPPGEDDFYTGTISGTLPPECEGPERTMFVGAWLDPTDPSQPESGTQVLGSNFRAQGSGSFSATIPLATDAVSFQPAVTTTHTLKVEGDVGCAGAAKTGTVDSVEIRVVGTK